MVLRSLALIILSAILGLSSPACAPKLIPDGWIHLGQAEITFATTRATVSVARDAPAVKRLIIVALVNDIDFTSVHVVFESGEPFEHKDRARISPDRDSIVLDLPGERRKIREVVVQYQNVRQTARRAEVSVWGDPS